MSDFVLSVTVATFILLCFFAVQHDHDTDRMRERLDKVAHAVCEQSDDPPLCLLQVGVE